MKKKLIRTVWRKLFPPTQLDLVLDEVESRLEDYEAWQVTKEKDLLKFDVYKLWSPKPTPLGITYSTTVFLRYARTTLIDDPKIEIVDKYGRHQSRLDKIVGKFVSSYIEKEANQLTNSALQFLTKGQKKPK